LLEAEEEMNYSAQYYNQQSSGLYSIPSALSF